MPLHLLGKKSWNVYNAANIERVRRDEAAAQAAEEAAEERMQAADAARRLAIMRGEEPPPLPVEDAERTATAVASRDAFPTGERRKRKRAGEDDTDFEMRVVRERAAEGEAVAARLASGGPRRTDEEGTVEKRREDGREPAPGPTTFGAMKEVEAGWYVKRTGPDDVDDAPGRDAWGNEDPGRKARDVVRLDKNDPLAMMKRGAAKVRELDKERKREAEEREKELRALSKEQRRREKRRRREDGGRGEVDDIGGLDGFSLDAPAEDKERGDTERRHEIRHRNRHNDGRRHERDKRDRRDSRHRIGTEERHHRPHRGEDDRHRRRHRHHDREERL